MSKNKEVKKHPAGVIYGLALSAKKEGRLRDVPVRGISEIGANIDSLRPDQWIAILRNVEPDVRRALAALRQIPLEQRHEYGEILRRVAFPDPGFEGVDYDLTQAVIDLLYASDESLKRFERVVVTLDILT